MPDPSVDQYGYEVRSGRYRNLRTGQYVPTQDIRDLVQTEITAGYERMQQLAARVVAGEADLGQLQDAMISHLRTSHTAMYTLGRGGIRQMTATDYQALTAFLEQEYTYLDGFMADIENGSATGGQVVNRMKQYGEAIWTSYNEGESSGAQSAGYTEEKSIAVDDQGTCDECHDIAALDWQPIGTLKKPGTRKCRRRCRCYFEYRGLSAQGRVRLKN